MPFRWTGPVLAIFAATAFGQDPLGRITGFVSDSTEAAAPNVRLEVTNMATGVASRTTTNEAGNYTIPFLSPGFYRVSAEASGFKKFVREGVQVRVSETVDLSIQMEIGPLTETIQVTSESPVLERTSASLGQVIDQRRAMELPITAGNPLQLLLLAPGITEPSTFLWKAAWNFRQITSDGNGATEQRVSNRRRLEHVQRQHQRPKPVCVRPASSFNQRIQSPDGRI